MEMHEFYRNSAIIIGMLTDNFKIFIEDFSKSYPNDYQNMSIDNLELLINYKEDLFQKYNYDGLVEEIISLYKKVIDNEIRLLKCYQLIIMIVLHYILINFTYFLKFK